MKSIKLIWQKVAPLQIQSLINLYTDTPVNKEKRKAFLRNAKSRKKSELTPEEVEAIRFFKTHRFSPFPFRWTLKYDNLMVDVLYDDSVSFYYVLFEGKRLYFPKNYTRNQVIWTMRSILKEQDQKSAHLYLTEDFQVEEGTIMIDGGVAEGSLSLSLIEKVKKLYLIECEPNWVEALQLTFAPWKDKVVFIGKYLSDKSDEQNINIDSMLEVNPQDKYFIKLDVEGYEKQTLIGMSHFFSVVKNLKMCVCTYHFQKDADEIYAILTGKGLKCEFSDGYLLFDQGSTFSTFRKALIRAEKI